MQTIIGTDVVALLARALQHSTGLVLSAHDVVELTLYQEVQDIFFNRFDCFIDAPEPCKNGVTVKHIYDVSEARASSVEYISTGTTEMCSKFLDDVIQYHVESKENEVVKLTLELAVISKENAELKARLRDIADERNH